MAGVKKLTDKQKRFCELYLVDLNATKAAIGAGYPEASAASIGYENLRKPEIKRCILEKQVAFTDECLITKNMILAELAKYGFRGREGSYQDTTPKDAIAALNMLGDHFGLWDEKEAEPNKWEEALKSAIIQHQKIKEKSSTEM